MIRRKYLISEPKLFGKNVQEEIRFHFFLKVILQEASYPSTPDQKPSPLVLQREYIKYIFYLKSDGRS
jgi:hypothetical protein